MYIRYFFLWIVLYGASSWAIPASQQWFTAIQENGANFDLENQNGETAFRVRDDQGELHLLLDAVDEDGNSALHLAAISGHVNVIRALSALGANLNLLSGRGLHILHWAVLHNEVDIINALHQLDPTLIHTLSRNGNHAIHLAVMQGQVEVVGALLELGVDLNTRNSNRVTALELATATNNNDIIVLLNNFRDRNAKGAHRAFPSPSIMPSPSIERSPQRDNRTIIEAQYINLLDHQQVLRIVDQPQMQSII